MKSEKSLSTHLNADLEPLRVRVQRRREYLELLETELTNTRTIVLEFTRLYNERITPLENEQTRLRKMLEELTADLAPPPSGWQGRKRHAPPKAASNGHESPEPAPKEKPAASKDVAHERKVRDLFRRLAKQYHPDLAQDEEERARNASIMAEINQAYMAKNLAALESLAKDHKLFESLSDLPEAELAKLTLELRQLESLIFEVEQIIRDLDLSPAMQMHSDGRGERGGRRDPLVELETDYRGRINDLREQLTGMGVEV